MTPSSNVAALPASPVSSRSSHHRRVTSVSGQASSPSTASTAAGHGALGLGAPPPGQGNVVNGLTPSFELVDNPLASPPPSRSTAAHSRQRSQPAATGEHTSAQAPTMFASPPDTSSHAPLPSTSKAAAISSSSLSSSHAGPSQPRLMHVDVAAANQRFVRQRSDDDGSASYSPSMRRLHTPLHSGVSAHSPSHAGLHHRPFSPQQARDVDNLSSQDPLRRAWTPPARSPTRISMGTQAQTHAHAHAHAHAPAPRPMPLETPRRQGSIQRAAAAAQSMLENLGARASPTLFRNPGAKEVQSDRSSSSSDDDEDDEDSSRDSAKYAHVAHRHSMTTSRSSRRTPRPRAALTPRSAKVALAAGHAHDYSGRDDVHDHEFKRPDSAGRQTPAKYRPSRGSAKIKSNSTDPSWYPPPLSYHQGAASGPGGHRTSAAAGSSMSSQHSSILIGSPVQGSSSPLVVPQARRGAMNLKSQNKGRSSKAGRSRRSRRARRSRRRRSGPRKPFLQSLMALCSNVIWHAAHPIHTVRVFKSYLVNLLRDIDHAFRDPIDGRRVWWPEWLGAYIPLLIWLGISITSTVTVLIFHKQVFKGLDQLSQTLQHLGFGGRMVLGSLIFITTFPPLPLYSTLIILCGFSFGLWQGFIISYIAALSGAVVVYLLSKSLLRGWMTNLLAKSGGLKKVVRAIEKRPKLLFLIRLAPYPYNLMNTLLASSPTLTFKTYFICTALALPKLLVHCGLGTSIKNFAAYNGAAAQAGSGSGGGGSGGAAQPSGGTAAGTTPATHTAETVKHIAGFVGVALCIGIFIYLFSVARRAVDEEVGSDEECDDDADEEHEELDRRARGASREIEGEEYDALYLNSQSEDEDEDEDVEDAEQAEYTDEEPDPEGEGEGLGLGFEAHGGRLRSSSSSDSDSERTHAPADLHLGPVKGPARAWASHSGFGPAAAGEGAGAGTHILDDVAVAGQAEPAHASLQHFRIASPDAELELELDAGVEKEFEGFARELK